MGLMEMPTAVVATVTITQNDRTMATTATSRGGVISVGWTIKGAIYWRKTQVGGNFGELSSGSMLVFFSALNDISRSAILQIRALPVTLSITISIIVLCP